MKLTTKELVRISIAVALIAVGAQIKVPSPLSGYFTLQLPMILTILGRRNSVITMFNQLYFGKTVSYIAAIVSIFSLYLVMDLVLAYFASTAGFKIRKVVGR